jgi:hypothetical protein
LLRDIRSAQQRLAYLADVKSADDSTTAAPPIDLFLASLRTAWKEGSSRPTDRPILKAKRGRRRLDPLVQTNPQLLDWFRAKPWRTGAELLTKLQAEHPGAYPDKLLRTLQRRLKSWRSKQASALLFGSPDHADADRRDTSCALIAPAFRYGGGRSLRNPGQLHDRPPALRPPVLSGAKWMRQRSRLREHSFIRQYAFSSRLSRDSKWANRRHRLLGFAMLANHGTQNDLLAHCGDDGRWAADASSQERRATNFI